MQTSSVSTKRNFLPYPSIPTAPLALLPSIDTHQALGSPDRRAGAKRLRGLTAPISPTNPPHRSPIRNRIPPRTACTSLSPSLREVPRPSGEARGFVRTSNSTINRDLSMRLTYNTVGGATSRPPTINAVNSTIFMKMPAKLKPLRAADSRPYIGLYRR